MHLIWQCIYIQCVHEIGVGGEVERMKMHVRVKEPNKRKQCELKLSSECSRKYS